MTIKNTHREKLLHATIFFAGNVKKPTMIKIFKLLYFLDFIHFSQTGKSVTNLDYYAFEKGPVPKEFYNEINDKLPDDYKKFFNIKKITTSKGYQGNLFEVLQKPNLTVFSPREKKILEAIAEYFKYIDAEGISEISHLKNQPWDMTWNHSGQNKRIDYKLALDSSSNINPAWITQITNDRKEIHKNFKIKDRV